MGFVLQWSNHLLDLRRKTHVMGVLNVTPDSFSDGGLFFEAERAVEQGLSLAAQGADMIDVGGESTRPYSRRISDSEEMDRVIPVIQTLAREVNIPISIDTYKGAVAREAIRAGASMINDISALRFDPQMPSVAAAAGVPLICMHMKGTPETMQVAPSYSDLIREISDFLDDAVKRAVAGGVQEELIIVDPGIGFGKGLEDNLTLIRELSRFASLGRPILLGTSNKSFIGRILGKELHERDLGTMATVAAGALNGAHIVRVHKVREAVETVKIIDAVKWGKGEPVEERVS
jgi:dihydropteroate synthase